MPKISVPKTQLEGQKPILPGIYEVRMDGFEPKKSKSGTSVNLNPLLKVINHPIETDKRVWDNLNSSAGWIHRDFCHAFGLQMTDDGDDASIPGEFQGPDDDPTKWTYVGPLIGQVGQIEIVETQGNNGKTRSSIKRYICRIPGCTDKHSDDLT